MPDILRPNKVEISVSALRYNFLKLKKIIKPSVKIMFVVKADAYGHGMIKLSNIAEREKLCHCFGVSSIEEGIILRENGIKSPILVLGSVYPLKNFKYIIENDLTPTISSVLSAKEFIKWCNKLNKKNPCHIKIETGMNRIGVNKETALNIVSIVKNSNSYLEGIYSHLSSADSDREYTLWQINRFKDFISELNYFIKNTKTTKKIIKHIANSAGTINFKNAHFDMVRCGYCLYGGLTNFKPVMEWKTRIVFIKNIKKGSCVSYNQSFKALKNMRIATLPVGYGDGYLRAISKNGYVLINGQKSRIIGNITMDMMMIDISHLKNIRVGDEVILIGKSGKEEIKISDLAKWANTIGYEITTIITKRVPRIYKE